jgi:predicted transcriptional regulator
VKDVAGFVRLGHTEYGGSMPSKKITISLPEELVERASKLASDEGLPFSNWVAGAVEQRARVQDGLAAMREWEAESGTPKPSAIAWVDNALAKADEAMRPQGSHHDPARKGTVS